MSFMFNPHPYDDLSAINRPKVSDKAVSSIVSGTRDVAQTLCREAGGILAKRKGKGSCVIALDGYPSADWRQTVNLMTQIMAQGKVKVSAFDVSAAYKSPEELERRFSKALAEDREKDPVLLFGKLNTEGYAAIFDQKKLKSLIQSVGKSEKSGGLVIVYGCGCADKPLRKLYDLIVYFDVTPKQSVLRAKQGLYMNLGDRAPRPFKALVRRCYYIDFEAAGHLRGELLKEKAIDFYVASDNPANLTMLPKEALREILSSLAKCPFRCKPVYLEGVWGGQYVIKARALPKTLKNVAWVFDLIPLEVSILVEAGKHLVELPYFTFVQSEGEAIMGRDCVKKFHGYFPIRFNYDDTFHSSGNMSIQVHPGEDYAMRNFNEHGRQDESYYVVATGHGAKTYIGFNEDADVEEFIREAQRSERDFKPVDHDKYVHSVPSRPGVQFMLPAGTIHASGRNQVILEIGSLTIGSYTFKMYDYLRPDLDGVPRPIHTWHGERVLERDRKTNWVRKNLIQEPRTVRSGKGFSEQIVGQHDLIYFSLRRLEFEREIKDDTKGRFHVLTLVDGERVVVQSLSDPERQYFQNYLDVVVVPANMGPYVVKNLGDHPVVIHKTLLKDGFQNE